MDDQHPEKNYHTDLVLYDGPYQIDPFAVIGMIKAFNEHSDNLPEPLLSVRVEPLPGDNRVDYLLFGVLWPDRDECYFGTITATAGSIELHNHIYRDWAEEYFLRFKTIKLGIVPEEKETSQTEIPSLPITTIEQLLMKLCIDWAHRDSWDSNMGDFLTRNLNRYPELPYLSVDQFKKVLPRAGKLGLITKINGRWRPNPKK